MVSVVVTSDDDRHEAARSLQRFLSAVAFAFDQPVEDVSYGARTGSGETDPYHWAGHRAHQAFRTLSKHTAPASIEVESDPQLGVALAYYRESVNAASPFYRFLALWNVLSAVFDIEREALAGKGTPTSEAARRDAFIRREAPKYAWRSRRAAPVTGDLARYFREDARNAIAHVRRSAAREIDPDDPDERVRLSDDADW